MTIDDATNKKITSIKNNISDIQNVTLDYKQLIHEVFNKIKSVDGISNKTNLLAINASIEAIHASDLLASFEQIVTNNLLIQARIIAKIIEHDPDFFNRDGVQFAKDCDLEEFFVTDEQGIVQFTNLPVWQNTKLNSSEILRILKDPNLEIALPSTGNQFDGTQFKVVGIGRVDRPGIIQLGAHFIRPSGQLAIDGFGVVAREAKRLADVSKEISSNITQLTSEMGEKITMLHQLSDGLAETIKKIEKFEEIYRIKSEAASLENSLLEIRKYFKNILSPLTDLINIVRQTKLLGVRAAIEAAHSTNDKQDFDNLLNLHMTAEAKLSATFIEVDPDITCEDLVGIAKYMGIGEFWITDENGVVDLTNIEGGKGFVFKNEGQTAPYMKILINPDLVVTAPPSKRSLDNRVYKFAAVGRRGKPGIFQIGNPSKMYGESAAEGFSEVSKQIKNLAEQSREITLEIEEMINNMDFKAQKALLSIREVNKQI